MTNVDLIDQVGWISYYKKILADDFYFLCTLFNSISNLNMEQQCSQVSVIMYKHKTTSLL